MKGPGVYFIQAKNGLVKIGRSAHVQQRLAVLKTSSPSALSVLHFIPTEEHIKTESEFHFHYAEKRQCGEWFALSSEDIALILSGFIPHRPGEDESRREPKNRVLDCTEHLSVSEAAELLDITYQGVTLAIKRGRLSKVVQNGLILIPRTDVLEYQGAAKRGRPVQSKQKLVDL